MANPRPPTTPYVPSSAYGVSVGLDFLFADYCVPHTGGIEIYKFMFPRTTSVINNTAKVEMPNVIERLIVPAIGTFTLICLERLLCFYFINKSD